MRINTESTAIPWTVCPGAPRCAAQPKSLLVGLGAGLVHEAQPIRLQAVPVGGWGFAQGVVGWAFCLESPSAA